MNYLTIIEAQEYFDTRLNIEAWDNASATDRTKSLSMSTRIIDGLNYLGSKTDSSQENQFPRGGETDIPTPIKNACAEIALALLDGVEPDLELENLGIVHQGISSAKTTYDRSFVAEHSANGVPSATAWAYLKPYMVDIKSLTLNRVN